MQSFDAPANRDADKLFLMQVEGGAVIILRRKAEIENAEFNFSLGRRLYRGLRVQATKYEGDRDWKELK